MARLSSREEPAMKLARLIMEKNAGFKLSGKVHRLARGLRAIVESLRAVSSAWSNRNTKGGSDRLDRRYDSSVSDVPELKLM